MTEKDVLLQAKERELAEAQQQLKQQVRCVCVCVCVCVGGHVGRCRGLIVELIMPNDPIRIIRASTV